MRVNPLGLSTSHDWLFLDPPGIFDNGSDLKTTLTIRHVCALAPSVTLHLLLAWKSIED